MDMVSQTQRNSTNPWIIFSESSTNLCCSNIFGEINLKSKNQAD
jgi:hypothetical protein